jgi:hypothetical protein
MKYIKEEEQDFIAWDNVVSIQLVKDLCKLLFCFWFICIVILLYFRCWPWKPIFIVYSIQHTVKPQVWYVASFSICHENITTTTKTYNTCTFFYNKLSLLSMQFFETISFQLLTLVSYKFTLCQCSYFWQKNRLGRCHMFNDNLPKTWLKYNTWMSNADYKERKHKCLLLVGNKTT